MTTENTQTTMHGNPLKVSGTRLKVGESIPTQVRLTNADLKDVSLESFLGKPLVISVIPSIDTPVCQLQTKEFNQAISRLDNKVTVLTISRDLPFAQKRWCAAEGVSQVVCVSDHKLREVGAAFGLELDDLGLLARAVFVVSADGKIEYVEYVPEIGDEPNYEAVLKALSSL